jgi:lambda family phage portal protein
VDSDAKERHIKMAPGLIFDNLKAGEEIGTIEHNRPNPNLGTFRSDMLKAAASGTMAQYSTISKNYDGNYSSQRQELIEQQVNYLVLTDEFIDQFTMPIVETFIRMQLLGEEDLPADVDRNSLFDVEYQGPALPWIDPVKEATGYLQLVRGGFTSKTKVIRSLGGNPQRVAQQLKQEREADDRNKLVFTSDAKHNISEVKK